MLKGIVLAVGLVCVGALSLSAQVPRLLNYQAHLAAGDTSLTGSYKMTFSVYPGPSGGTPVWTESQVVQVTDGLFSVLLGGSVPIPALLFSESDRYLGVRVESDAEMVPRQRIVSVGYAFRAETADDVRGRDITPASLSLTGPGPVIDRQGRWVGGNVVARAVTTDSLVSGTGGLVVDRQGRWVGGDVRAHTLLADSVGTLRGQGVVDQGGRWVGGDVRARVVTIDTLMTSGGRVLVDSQGRWVGPEQPGKLTYVSVGPKASSASPVSINGNSWSDLEAFGAYVTVTAQSLLDIRFDGMLAAGSNCMVRIRVDGNTSVGNLSGIADARTGERRHTGVGISAIASVGAGEHQVFLQGIVSAAADGQFLTGLIQSGLLTVRIYPQ